MEEKMKPRIAAGLESTLDIVISFPDLETFEDFARYYEGELSECVWKGYEAVKNQTGGETPIDGKKEEAKRLLEKARGKGAKISYGLGGNGIQEAVALEKIGVDSIYLGGISSRIFSRLPKNHREAINDTDMCFVQFFEKYEPASYILQAEGTNRYILSEGEGRRINQLRSYILNLPKILEEVIEKYGGLDALSLVGWHVVFGKGLSEEDFELVIRSIDGICQDTNVTLFTDAGGIGDLTDRETKRLWDIYSKFDILSVNDDELRQISEVLSVREDNEVRKMLELKRKSENLSTIWLHNPYYQITLSDEFSSKELEEAQRISSLAALYKIEKGDYPTLEKISYLSDTRNISEKGVKKERSISERYGSKIEGCELVVTPCYEDEEFVSAVGAGDVASAAYLCSLTS